jgi:RNA polymerase sigma-54 factor
LNTFILNDDERDIAEFLVGIDDMGYIRRSVPDIVDDYGVTQGLYTDEATVERMLNCNP